METALYVVEERQLESFTGGDVVKLPDRAVIFPCHAALEPGFDETYEVGLRTTDDGFNHFRALIYKEPAPELCAEVFSAADF